MDATFVSLTKFTTQYDRVHHMQASNQVREYVELVRETLVSISEAIHRFPVKTSRPSVERYIRRGVRGIRLKTCYLGGRRWTSIEEIERFIAATQRSGDETHAVPTIPPMSNRDLDIARKKFNMPPAGKNGVADEQQLTND